MFLPILEIIEIFSDQDGARGHLAGTLDLTPSQSSFLLLQCITCRIAILFFAFKKSGLINIFEVVFSGKYIFEL